MIYSADQILPVTAEPIIDGAVLVREGRIVAVGARDEIMAEYGDEEETRFRNSLLMPGLVNLHGHIECSSFENLARPSSFSDWLGGIIGASAQLDRDGWLAASREGVKRYLESGITCTADITRSGTGIQALIEVGMPAVAYIEAVAIDRKNLAFAVVDLLEKVKSAQSMSDAPWFKVGLSPHSPYTLSEEALKVCAQIAGQYELPLTMHLAETNDESILIAEGSGSLAERIGSRLEIEAILNGGEDKTPAEFANDAGLLRHGLIAAHGVWLNDSDIELLKSKGTVVAVCPTSNEILNTGTAPITKFIESGLTFGIGTDSAASNPHMDLFVEARKVAAITHATHSNSITPRALVEKLTIEAAHVLGLHEHVGSIEPGKRADLVVIDYPSSRDDNAGNTDRDATGSSGEIKGYQPVDLYEYLIERASRASVSHTILRGTIVYKLK